LRLDYHQTKNFIFNDFKNTMALIAMKQADHDPEIVFFCVNFGSGHSSRSVMFVCRFDLMDEGNPQKITQLHTFGCTPLKFMDKNDQLLNFIDDGKKLRIGILGHLKFGLIRFDKERNEFEEVEQIDKYKNKGCLFHIFENGSEEYRKLFNFKKGPVFRTLEL
jgi:hypothetical protein